MRTNTKLCLLTLTIATTFNTAVNADESKKTLSATSQALMRDSLFVVNGQDNTLTVIDPIKNTVSATIALPKVRFPHHISLSPDGSRLAIAAPGADLSLGHDVDSIGHGEMSMGEGQGAKMSVDKEIAKSLVLVLDSRSGKKLLERRFSKMNYNAIFSPDSKEIWTGQMGSPGTVLVLDAKTLKQLKAITVGNKPAEVTFSIDGKNAFVANGESNSVSVIDTRTKRLIKTIPVGKEPVGAWQGKEGLMYVDNETSKSLTAIDAKTLLVKRTYSLGFTPGMAASAPNSELWVSDSENGKVAFYKSDRSDKLGELATGAGAHAIVFSKDGKTGYVSNQNANSVSVIDIKSHTVKANIAVGKKPNGMVWRAN
ncbi:MAG: hypothetical protein JST01_22815 [Cyanobacteria bacterium SZAS TMP-1]|nr:hypothetical protein [Cyanobacteria bacterium SZAS TMP-1]